MGYAKWLESGRRAVGRSCYSLREFLNHALYSHLVLGFILLHLRDFRCDGIMQNKKPRTPSQSSSAFPCPRRASRRRGSFSGVSAGKLLFSTFLDRSAACANEGMLSGFACPSLGDHAARCELVMDVCGAKEAEDSGVRTKESMIAT